MIPAGAAARKWLQTSLCVLPQSSSSCPFACAELGTEAHYNEGLGMAGDTWLEAKCLPSAGAARASMKCRVPVLVLTLHFSAGAV